MRKRYIMVLLLFVLFSSCKEKAVETKAPEKPVPPAFSPLYNGNTIEDHAKNLVLRYNELLVFGYKNLDMNFLQEVATVPQAEKAYFHMAAIGEGGVRMVSRLNKIDFKNVSHLGDDKIIVKTREIWDFEYTDIRTGKKDKGQKDFVYPMTYLIEKQKDGRWLIVDTFTASEGENPPGKPSKSQPAGRGEKKK